MFTPTPMSQSPAFQSRNNMYRVVGIETQVSTATPHRLVGLLFDALLEAIAQARGAIQAGNIELKGRSTGRAVRIIEEGLKAGLNLEAGGELATNLHGLYGYLCARLIHANLRSDDAALAECVRLIEPLRSAWQSIGGDSASH